MDFEDGLKLCELNVKSKKKYKSICTICGKEYEFYITGLLNRTWKVDVCGKCYVPKFVTKQSEWKKHNSKAQQIAQNRPDVKLKNSVAVTEFWKNNPEIKKRIANKNSKRWAEDEEYRNSVNKNRYRGIINTNNFGKIRFDSRLEIYYIIQADRDESIKNLKRYDLEYIEYFFNDIKRHYIPDFIINGERVVEVKSNFLYNLHRNNIDEKIKAFKKKYPNMRYSLLKEDAIYYTKSMKSLARSGYEIIFYKKEIQDKFLSHKYEN